MKYLCLIYTDPAYPVVLSDREEAQLVDEMMDYDRALRENGHALSGEALQMNAAVTNVRVRDGNAMVTDGPFVETKEQLTGFLLIEARDLNEAVRVASNIPAARYGTVEIRTVRELVHTGDNDDDLLRFEAEGPPPLPAATYEGYVDHDNARIWCAAYGAGKPVILLHGGLGNSRNWGYQVPALVAKGFRAVVIDSRGHGRSTRDERPYSYELMAGDVLAVMDSLGIDSAALVGWSDGACTSLILSSMAPARVAGVLYFACNMDPSGTKEFKPTPVVDRCFSRHRKDYAELSAAPDQFDAFVAAVGLMQRTQPNWSASDLARVRVPVTVVHSEHDEFIKREHAEYLSRTIPHAKLVYLPGVSHFAPLQRPDLFDTVVIEFAESAFAP